MCVVHEIVIIHGTLTLLFWIKVAARSNDVTNTESVVSLQQLNSLSPLVAKLTE